MICWSPEPRSESWSTRDHPPPDSTQMAASRSPASVVRNPTANTSAPRAAASSISSWPGPPKDGVVRLVQSIPLPDVHTLASMLSVLLTCPTATRPSGPRTTRCINWLPRSCSPLVGESTRCQVEPSSEDVHAAASVSPPMTSAPTATTRPSSTAIPSIRSSPLFTNASPGIRSHRVAFDEVQTAASSVPADSSWPTATSVPSTFAAAESAWFDGPPRTLRTSGTGVHESLRGATDTEGDPPGPVGPPLLGGWRNNPKSRAAPISTATPVTTAPETTATRRRRACLARDRVPGRAPSGARAGKSKAATVRRATAATMAPVTTATRRWRPYLARDRDPGRGPSGGRGGGGAGAGAPIARPAAAASSWQVAKRSFLDLAMARASTSSTSASAGDSSLTNGGASSRCA